MPTNQKVGSSTLSGRTIKSTTYKLIGRAQDPLVATVVAIALEVPACWTSKEPQLPKILPLLVIEPNNVKPELDSLMTVYEPRCQTKLWMIGRPTGKLIIPITTPPSFTSLGCNGNNTGNFDRHEVIFLVSRRRGGGPLQCFGRP